MKINYKKPIVLLSLLLSLFILVGCGGNKDSKSLADGDNTSKIDSEFYCYFYEAENEERYKSFSEINPDLSKEDVVWQVNSNLDKDPYTDIKTVKDPDSITVLVNKYNKLPDGYVPSDLVDTGYASPMRSEAFDAYKNMKEAAETEGIYFTTRNAYRGEDLQTTYYEDYKNSDGQELADTYSARPRHSEHECGLSMDLRANSQGEGIRLFTNTDEAKWIAKNAYKYGFILRYPEGYEDITGYVYESWHIRYIGEKAAKEMKDNNIMTFEEYVVKFIDHRPN